MFYGGSVVFFCFVMVRITLLGGVRCRRRRKGKIYVTTYTKIICINSPQASRNRVDPVIPSPDHARLVSES